MKTFADYFFKSTACYSDLIAVLDPENHASFTFEDLKTKTNSFVKALQEIGVQKKDRIGTFTGNSTEFLIFCLAANQIGAILEFLRLIRKIYSEIQLSQDADFVTLTNKDTVYGVLPFFHAGGFLTVFMMLVQGAKVLINRKFDEDKFLENIEKYQVTVLNLVPPILDFLTFSPKCDARKNLSSLRYIYVGAAPVRKELNDIIFRKFWNVQLIQLYGSTESGVLVFMTPKKSKFQEQLATKPGPCGLPLPGVQVKIAPLDGENKDENYGELLLKTTTEMKGYIKSSIDSSTDPSIENPFDEDGFYRTGDLARVDSDGFYYIVGRSKEMIKVRGWQVSPYELEDALRQKFPQIVEIGVVGIPEDKDGEQPSAIAVLAPGTMLSAGEIETFVSENFISYKRLTAGVHFLDSLPKTPSGKLDRLRLKQMLLEVSEFED
ncbi:hypothetical protein FO519_005569 [Halicephalobus sp. NKZ332]|nr:hypothetical protein FO519_005569 [Halicephalobus sp. NKZ332]